jgi:butyryl-CoA dehydrogenase
VNQASETDTRFYRGKLRTMKYFFHYELPKILGLAQRLQESDLLTVGMVIEEFDD